jgi:hypothetical protein
MMVVLANLLAGCGGHARIEDPSVDRRGKDTTITPQMAALAADEQHVLDDMHAGRYGEAESLVDRELSNPRHGCYMALRKAELLALRRHDSDAESMYMQVLKGTYGAWHPNSALLKQPFDLAVKLGRSADLDLLSTTIIANQANLFGVDGSTLLTPTTGSTSAAREAYACLALALDASFNQDDVGQVNYCLQAQSLLPGDTLVLVHLAVAYHDRAQTGDLATARSLLSRAFTQAQAGSQLQSDIQAESNLLGIGALP